MEKCISGGKASFARKIDQLPGFCDRLKWGLMKLSRYKMNNFLFFLSLFRCLNRAMKAFDATVVVPTNFVLFTISAIISGKYLY